MVALIILAGVGILLFIATMMFALGSGIVALNEIKDNPDKYKGKTAAGIMTFLAVLSPIFLIIYAIEKALG